MEQEIKMFWKKKPRWIYVNTTSLSNRGKKEVKFIYGALCVSMRGAKIKILRKKRWQGLYWNTGKKMDLNSWVFTRYDYEYYHVSFILRTYVERIPIIRRRFPTKFMLRRYVLLGSQTIMYWRSCNLQLELVYSLPKFQRYSYLPFPISIVTEMFW